MPESFEPITGYVVVYRRENRPEDKLSGNNEGDDPPRPSGPLLCSIERETLGPISVWVPAVAVPAVPTSAMKQRGLDAWHAEIKRLSALPIRPVVRADGGLIAILPDLHQAMHAALVAAFTPTEAADAPRS